jgi:GTPase
MFDRAYISVSAGKGGRGTVAFRREKFVPRGGPAGGDGGDGGSVILVASHGVNTLNAFRYKREFKAGAGRIGGGSNKTGRDGEPLTIDVPPGTRVFEVLDGQTERERVRMIGDLERDGQRLVVAAGGAGGRGNSRFVTSIKREPLLAEDGDEGVTRKLRLDLVLVADVGIVGLPNAGKSSLIAALSNARPKVADYPFTTIQPNLGVVEHHMRTLVAVDVPGLIEGAHDGIGLGHEFLRHLERTRLLVHLIDGGEGEPARRFRLINSELDQYGTDLRSKPQIVVVNKVDIPEVDMLRDEIAAELKSEAGVETEVLFISAAGLIGLEALKNRMFQALDETGAAAPPPASPAEENGAVPTLRPLEERGIVAPAERTKTGFLVTHRQAVRLANGSDLSNWKVQVQMRDRLKAMGVTDALVRLGIESGDMVSLGEWDFEWE